jgi:hypothetical protein
LGFTGWSKGVKRGLVGLVGLGVRKSFSRWGVGSGAEGIQGVGIWGKGYASGTFRVRH